MVEYRYKGETSDHTALHIGDAKETGWLPFTSWGSL